MLISAGFAFLVLGRAAYIQLLNHPKLEGMARRQFQSSSLIRPQRGFIVDRNGEPLAVNVETNSLAANPSKIQNKVSISRSLAKSTGIPQGKILQKLRSNKEFVWIKRHLSEGEIKRFKKWRIMDSEGDFVDGLWLVKESERVYPHRQLASQIVGDVNLDSVGIEGIELWMDEKLRGKVVSVSAVKDALGRPTFIDAEAIKNVKDGETVALTIDASLQFEVEQALTSAMRRSDARSGTVIVMNASNGEILALANQPSFDPNQKGVPAENRRNRALTDGFEPGSTFKAVLLASALSNGWKLTDQVWGEKGSFYVQGRRISEAEAHERFEWIDLKKLIKVSSNVAAAKVALKLGADKLYKTVRAFGFGSKTGSGFPGEISGRIPPRKEWSPLTLANIGFGQGILVTPIQMIRAYATFLNGGYLVEPTILSGEKSEPLRILSSHVADSVTEALLEVTEGGGTGLKAALSGYKVAGKTGTAQMVDPETGKYSRQKHIASFIGYAVGIEPKIVIFTSLSEPRGSYYASETAAPLFREVLKSVANHCSLPVNLPPAKILAQRLLQERNDPSGDLKGQLRDRLKLSYASAVNPIDLKSYWQEQPQQSGWVMPSLKGLTARETLQILLGHRFRFQVQGNGVVVSQMPEAGKKIAEGDTIRLILSEP